MRESETAFAEHAGRRVGLTSKADSVTIRSRASVFPSFDASPRFLPDTDVIAAVTLWFEAPLCRPAEMRAGTVVTARGSALPGGRRLVTTEPILITPPTIVALEGSHARGAMEDLLPRARRGLPLGLPLGLSPKGEGRVRLAMAGQLWGTVLRATLWWSPPGLGGPPNPAFGPWELWSDSALQWRAPETIRRPLLDARVDALGPPAPAELHLARRPAQPRFGHPARWWLRSDPLSGDYEGVRVLREVGVQLIGVTVAARALSEGPGPAIGPATAPRPGAAAGGSMPAHVGTGSAKSPPPATSALTAGHRLPFRLGPARRAAP